MILGQHSNRSPEHTERKGPEEHDPLPAHHLSCRQVARLSLRHDDVFYHSLPVSRVLICARLIACHRETSPRGLPLLSLRLEDGTAACTVLLYHREDLESLCASEQYVKMGLSAKCGGLPYRPELKLVGSSLAPLPDPNELTEHFLECMRTELISGH
jgi:hypothetical protein